VTRYPQTGYAASIIATTLTQPSFFEAMNLATASNADALIGATNGLFYTEGIFGSFCCGWMSTTYGRKISATFGALLILISSALLTVAVNMGMFITFRFFTGWGCFQLLATVPLWIAEIAPPKIRGILVDIHPVMVNFGYTCASYVGIGFYYYTGGGKTPGEAQWACRWFSQPYSLVECTGFPSRPASFSLRIVSRRRGLLFIGCTRTPRILPMSLPKESSIRCGNRSSSICPCHLPPLQPATYRSSAKHPPENGPSSSCS
jgi:MFS family permease